MVKFGVFYSSPCGQCDRAGQGRALCTVSAGFWCCSFSLAGALGLQMLRVWCCLAGPAPLLAGAPDSGGADGFSAAPAGPAPLPAGPHCARRAAETPLASPKASVSPQPCSAPDIFPIPQNDAFPGWVQSSCCCLSLAQAVQGQHPQGWAGHTQVCTFPRASPSGTKTPPGATARPGEIPGAVGTGIPAREFPQNLWRATGKGAAVSVSGLHVPRLQRPALLPLNENIYIKYTSVVSLNIRCGH